MMAWLGFSLVVQGVALVILFVLYYGLNLPMRIIYSHIPGPTPKWMLGT